MRFLLLLFLLQYTPSGAPHAVTASSAPTLSVTSAVCVNNTATTTVNCAWGAAGAVGDLAIFKSKTAATVNTATVAWTFTGTTPCTPAAVVAPGAATFQGNGTGHFIEALYACIITTAGTPTAIATWVGGLGNFADIETFTVHTTNTWKTVFTDQTATNVATTTATTCPTGTTSATTTANDFILATCDTFNAAQTWGALTGFTQYAAASRNTAGIYYKSVTSTGTQTATIPLSATDFGVGIIAAFASN